MIDSSCFSSLDLCATEISSIFGDWRAQWKSTKHVSCLAKWKQNRNVSIIVTISTAIDIDQLPEKILKTLAEANGHPPSEEELREIYEAHRELKENVEKLKQEMNGNVQQFEIFSEKSKTDEEANALDLVTDLMQSCGIPCDEGNC